MLFFLNSFTCCYTYWPEIQQSYYLCCCKARSWIINGYVNRVIFFLIKDTGSVWFSLSFQQNLGLKAILQLHTALVLWDFLIWVCVCKLSNANVNLLPQYLGWVLGTQKRQGWLTSIVTRSISTEPYFVHVSVTNISK